MDENAEWKDRFQPVAELLVWAGAAQIRSPLNSTTVKLKALRHTLGGLINLYALATMSVRSRA